MSGLVSPELGRLVDDVREWAVAEIRPLGRPSDRDHLPVPEAAKAFESAPFRGSPATGTLEIDPRRGIRDGRYVAATAVTEAGVYGDMLFTAILPGGGIGGKVVELVGTTEQIERWCGGLSRGEFSYSGFALTEPGAGSDAAAIRTTARLEGDHWVLNGTKIFCSGGCVSDFLVVFATVDRELGHRGIRAFVVEKGTPGFTVTKENENKLGCRALVTSELLFEDVRLPLENCLGTADNASRTFGITLSALNTTRHQVASMACGIAQAALDDGSAHLRAQRSGYAAARWRRIEDDLQAMNAAVHRGRLLARTAAWRIDRGQPFDREASMAKAYAPPIAERVCLRIVELLGPDGWSEEFLFEKWYRDIKIIDIWEGTGNIQKRALSRSLFAAGRSR